ncbi:MAG TPA: GvpL/GvpF family gas vesicle protein [Candidatus Koribacter sp.]|jgi:hypothetical protein
MSVLAYCVSLVSDNLKAPANGVSGARVQLAENTMLRAWYSEVETDSFSGTEHVAKAALDFHRCVSAVFNEGTVLPFRFPTILDSVDDILVHLDEKGVWYYEVLQQIEGLAQFEARILTKAKLPVEAESGKQYLELRKQLHKRVANAVESLVTTLEPVLDDHDIRESQKATRVYLLVERSKVASLRAKAAKVTVPDGIEIRLTGPWPPTEFLTNDEDEE